MCLERPLALKLNWILRRFLAAAIAAISLIATGCGYIGGVIPPYANIPGDPTELAVVQRGSMLYAHFKLPQLTTELRPIKGDLELDLRAGPPPNPWNAAQWAEGARKIAPESVKDGVAIYRFPALTWAGKEITVATRVVGSNGKASNWSSLATFTVVSPLAVPADVAAVTVENGVRLTWRGPAGRYRILRSADGATYAEIGTSTSPEFLDSTAEFGKAYTYLVQAFTELADHREAQSDLSEALKFTPKDTFPPAAPTGLRATASANTVELSWEANTEPDLALYRVYRSTDGGAFEKIAEVTDIPTYSDKGVQAGKTYRYVITAVDKSGNESTRSTIAEATI
jgi:fibronectin type 3 domain-containing protein